MAKIKEVIDETIFQSKINLIKNFVKSQINSFLEIYISFAKISHHIFHNYYKNGLATIAAVLFAVIEGIALGLLGVSVSSMLKYTLVKANDLDQNILLSYAGRIFGSFTGVVITSQISENLLNNIAKKGGEVFYQENLKRPAYEQKGLVKMQTEINKVVNPNAIKDKYIKASIGLGRVYLDIIRSLTSSILIFLVNAVVAGASLSQAALFGAGFYAIGFTIKWIGISLTLGIQTYMLRLLGEVNKINNTITELRENISADPARFLQSNFQTVADNTRIKLENDLKIAEKKLWVKKLVLNGVNKLSYLLDVLSDLVPNVVAVALKRSSIIQVLGNFFLSHTMMILSNTNAQEEKANGFIPECAAINVQVNEIYEYARKVPNLYYNSPNNIIFGNFSLYVPGGIWDKVPDAEKTKRILIERTNAEFETGLIHILRGNTGGGKSTFLKAIAGIHHLFEGSISLPEIYRTPNAIQSVSQNGWQKIPTATLFEMLTQGITDARSSEELRAEIKFLFERVGLSDKFDKLDQVVSEPSGGEARRFLIIAAIVKRCKLLLIDEGLASLPQDGEVKINTENLLKDYVTGEYQYHPHTATIISIQHDNAKKDANFGDKIWELDEGVLKKSSRVASPLSVLQNPVKSVEEEKISEELVAAL